jgi:hypothetical protein
MANHMKPFDALSPGLKMREHLHFCECQFYLTIQVKKKYDNDFHIVLVCTEYVESL